MRLLPLYLKPESPRVLGNHNWIWLLFRHEVRIPLAEAVRLSVDRAGRLTCLGSTETQWVPVGRPLRSTVLLATVDRAVDRAAPVHVVHVSRPGGRPTPVLTCYEQRSRFLWTSISALSIPMSLKNSPDIFSLLLSPLSLRMNHSEIHVPLVIFVYSEFELLFNKWCTLYFNSCTLCRARSEGTSFYKWMSIVSAKILRLFVNRINTLTVDFVG